MYVFLQKKFFLISKKYIKLIFFAKNIIFICILLQGCVHSKISNSALIYDISQSKMKPAVANYDYIYVVKEGDTLYKIAQDNKISIEKLKKINNINNSNYLNVGQILIFHDKKITTKKFNNSKPIISNSKPIISNSNIHSNLKNNENWAWPSSGKIINNFSINQKGIDITANIGSPIISAADGKVVYCGNGVKGLGNLIILSHKNNFITAYAHIDNICVEKSQNVKKGEKIAEMGLCDNMNTPKLHFEIRSNGTPVNPINYLPIK
ncbi:Murein hydrolase activator NlpD [Candidatus Kinetoplastibacterium sorsogonicusi]|uniref:Murein hydrolase activator NlpD n=1 Tax=Candidatus Kinetoplastidibacterium kentomonadis TaxID=1576550 RepID=A0A3Q8ETL3_9PROT|nr:peptidoglycan DD-metalloendopeptidase family protein [Candidatus Kinetoplastibacterium sorsogonicusi]AWD32376.1 Murein hydrolase activator NlpD [Candidatus Kinetoplastibacterium sorsogonicusi]